MATHPFTRFMNAALEQARLAGEMDEVPVGAVVTCHGEIIARGHNRTRIDSDPTGHAEIIAIRAAAQVLGNYRLSNCDLWVTLEPCVMCAGAIGHARISRLYFGAADAKGGAVHNGVKLFDLPGTLHRPEVYAGIRESEAAELLRRFFAVKRAKD